jgi:hypothetical protein
VTIRSDIQGAENDIQAQVAALRAQLDALIASGTATAAEAVRDVRRATAGEFDTVVAQARNEPVASAILALGGAVLGFVLGRVCR